MVTFDTFNFTFILQVKAKASKWHRDLQLATPIILGTVPLTSYQPPVFSSGEKPPGEVNGETSSVPAGTGDATIGYNMQPSVGPVGIGEPQASGNSGWNMLPSDTNAQSQGVPYVQPNVAPQGPASASLYPDLCKYVRMSKDISSPFYKEILVFIQITCWKVLSFKLTHGFPYKIHMYSTRNSPFNGTTFSLPCPDPASLRLILM